MSNTVREYKAFATEVGLIVREHVGAAFRQLSDRIAALEAREIPRGEKGDQGEKGEPGRDGLIGPIGPAGDPGERGERGEKGNPGEKGEKGERGQEGPEGKPGRDGRDGLNGLQGERGLDGKDGRDGIDGKDGAGFPKDFYVELQGRDLIFKFGDQYYGVKLDYPRYRGVYNPVEKYDLADWASFGGSVFACMVDAPEGKPEQSKDWKLAVKRGQHGKDGTPGERGEKGSEGRPGRDLTQMTFNGEKY